MSIELDRELFEIDALLQRAASTLRYPPTPSISTAVRARLDERRPFAARIFDALTPRGWQPMVRAAFVMLVVAAIAIGVSLAVPSSRSALADFFHLSHVRVDQEPAAGPTPLALNPESFARLSTVAAAGRLADFPLRFPTKDGEKRLPDAVYVQGENSNLPTVIFAYDDYDLYQTRLGYFNKGGPDPSLVHEISFAGQPAYWIDEGGHIASFLDAEGQLVVESRRSVERATLLWEENGITYRLETSLAQDEAIRVAESLR